MYYKLFFYLYLVCVDTFREFPGQTFELTEATPTFTPNRTLDECQTECLAVSLKLPVH